MPAAAVIETCGGRDLPADVRQFTAQCKHSQKSRADCVHATITTQLCRWIHAYGMHTISFGTIVHTIFWHNVHTIPDQADAASVLLSCNITNCRVPKSYNNLQTAANHFSYPHWQSRYQPAGHAMIDKVDKLHTRSSLLSKQRCIYHSQQTAPPPNAAAALGHKESISHWVAGQT